VQEAVPVTASCLARPPAFHIIVSDKLAGMNATTRRTFLAQCAGTAAGVWVGPSFMHAANGSRPAVKFPTAPRERISIASYPFREFIAGAEHKSGNSTIELKDFAAHVVEKFNVHLIEPWSPHFPSTDATYLAEFRAAVEKAQVGLANIAVDGENSPYAAESAEHEKAIAFSKQWIDVAVGIGSPSVRTNIPGAKDSKPDVKRLTESLRRVVDYASAKNVVVHLENDNPVSEDPFFLVKAIDAVNSPWLRALPDFGNTLNTHKEDYAYRAIEAMFARAYGICHVKDGEVNRQGKATHVDLARTFGILKRHGYRGYCSIEYDAPGDPYKITAELVEKTVKYLS
jgi:sugar phosphate isomerase/epimerase